jgi:hypothetical protein
MKVQATHKGHCQVCGSLQKLPNGRMAKHGYTTKHGFFEGTCAGSDKLPYQVSCELIPASIDAANNLLAPIADKIAMVAAQANEGKVVTSETDRDGFTTYTIHTVETANNTHSEGVTSVSIYFTNENGKRIEIACNWSVDDANEHVTVAQAATKFNRIQITRLQQKAAPINHFITVQTKRLADWVAADCIAI